MTAEPHLVARARQCYGIDLSMADIRSLADQIASGKSMLMYRGKYGERHMVRHGDIMLIAIWSAALGCIVTIWPRDAAMKNRPGCKQKTRAGKNRFGGSRVKRSPRPRYEPEASYD